MEDSNHFGYMQRCFTLRNTFTGRLQIHNNKNHAIPIKKKIQSISKASKQSNRTPKPKLTLSLFQTESKRAIDFVMCACAMDTYEDGSISIENILTQSGRIRLFRMWWFLCPLLRLFEQGKHEIRVTSIR